jgi:hypothetical protein
MSNANTSFLPQPWNSEREVVDIGVMRVRQEVVDAALSNSLTGA